MNKTKLLLVFIIILSMMFSFSTVNASLKGDMDNDGTITIMDVRLLLQAYISGNWEEEPDEPEEPTDLSSGDFYLVVSDGVREFATGEDDSVRIKLANSENLEGTWYTFKQGVSLANFEGTALEKGAIYSAENPAGVFVWAKINDMDQISNLAIVSENLISGDCVIEHDKINPYTDSLSFDIFDENGYDNTNKMIFGQDGTYKVIEDTIVLMATPVEDENGEIYSFKLKIAENPELVMNSASGGLVAWNDSGSENRIAKYVFLTSESEESELMVGKVAKVRIGTKGVFAIIDKTELEVDMDKLDEDFGMDSEGVEDELPESFILYTETNNDKIVIKAFVTPDMLVGAPVVIAKSGTLVKLSGDPAEIDTALEENEGGYKSHYCVTLNAEENTDGYVEFVDGGYDGKGLSLRAFAIGDRVIIDSENKVVYIVTVDGCSEHDTLEFDVTGNVIIVPAELDDDEG